MKSILVAVDFSASSRAAMNAAAALAHRQKAPMILAHVVGPPPLELPVLPVDLTGQERNLFLAAEAELARDASELRRRGITVETQVVVGSAAKSLAALVRERDVGLIAMGTNGRKGPAHLILGSVAEHVVRTASCPVLVLREGTSPDLGRWEGSEPLRVLVGTDGAPAGDAAISWAGAFARSNGCDLSLLRLYTPWEELFRYGLDAVWDEGRRDHELMLLLQRDVRRQAQALTAADVSRTRFRATGRNDAATIAEEIALAGADLLVVGVPRHRMGQGAIIAPKDMLRSSPIPVLCVPEAPAALMARSAPSEAVGASAAARP